MAKAVIAPQLRAVAAIQARLMDRFIDLVQAELGRSDVPFTREALRDMVASLKDERDAYRGLVGLEVLDKAA
jgi:hypothetical protein